MYAVWCQILAELLKYWVNELIVIDKKMQEKGTGIDRGQQIP